jgi:aspartyl-tRNA(Asn)/glutamyl-tRNA(Gln) amidotransferase subunit A
MYLNDIFTVTANLAGIPAMSIPVGKDKDGLPIGLQLMAPHFEEARLFRAARQAEKLLG